MENNTSIKRTISFPLYLGALVITILIFGIGFYVGSAFNEQITDNISAQVSSIGTRIATIQLFFLLDESNEFCSLYLEELNKLDQDIEKVGYRLAYLEDVKGVVDENLKKDYFVLETSSYLIANRIKEKCGNGYTLLLYFYSNKNCEECKEQGKNILSARDETAGRIIKIYSFDGELGSEIVESLKNKFDISEYPTILIEGKKFEGLKTKEQLIEELKE